MTTEQVMQEIGRLKGKYTFKSPYHKGNKRLPFDVTGYSWDPEFPVAVSTVEYKGWTRIPHDGSYKLEVVKDFIQSGFIKAETI